LGNPGDGYEGKALATLLYDFSAEVDVVPAADFRIHPNPEDGLQFANLDHALRGFQGGGCEDALRLLRAALCRFPDLLASGADGLASWSDLGAHIRYRTHIPRQVGLSGSSALIIATLRALAMALGVKVDPYLLAEAALAAETEDLGVAAGPMDRIVQAYGGTVLMDLAAPRSASRIHSVDTRMLPPLFVAWSSTRTKNSGLLHGPLRARWLQGDPEVTEVVDQLRAVVDDGMAALSTGDSEAFGRCMERNFELRGRIFPIHAEDRAMVALAHRHGCAAKLAGSGGAIVGIVAPEADGASLETAFSAGGFRFLRPLLNPPAGDGTARRP